MINGAMSDPNYPRLGIGASLKQSVCSRHNISIDFKISGFDVDRHNFAIVARFDLLPNARLIKFLPTPSDLFFAVTSLADCHSFALGSTSPFQF
jgi:hypothetical protein